MPDIPRDTTLEKILELSRENNKILKKMHRQQQWANIMRVIYWLVIIGLILGSFYFIKPFLTQALDIYQGILGASGALQDVGGQIPGIENIGDILGGLGGQ